MGDSSPSVYDHYRTEGVEYEEGIYRVVGVGNGTVTLLLVGKSEGGRVNTGKLITVGEEELDDFAPAQNPDRGFSFVGSVVSAPETVYWSVRAFVAELSSHPIPALGALGLILVGYFGEGTLPVSDTVLGVLVVAGSLSLAYVGSGWMYSGEG